MITAWRRRALEELLRVVFVVGLLVAVPSVALAIATGLPAVVLVDLAAVTGVLVLARGSWLPYRVRAYGLLGIALALGLVLLVAVGPVAQVYLLLVPAVAALLLGAREGVLAVAVASTALVVTGWLADAPVALAPLEGLELAKWVTIGANFALVAGVITLSTGLVIRHLEAALSRERAALAELQDAHRELRTALWRAERLATIVEEGSDAMVVVGCRGSIRYHNAAAERLPGLRPPVPGESLAAWLGDPAARAELAVVLESAASGSAAGEVRLGTPEGPRLLAVRATSLSWDEPEPGHLLVIRDITSQREREQRERHLERLSTVGTLASGIAHDVNNVVGGIVGLADRIRDGGAPADHADLAADIVEACLRAREIVRRLLVFAGRDEGAREPFDAALAAGDALALVRLVIPPGIELRTEVATSAVLVARPSDVHQVLLNLATNAAQAIGDRSDGVIEVRVVDAVPDEDLAAVLPPLVAGARHLLIEVADNGPGIPDDVVPRVFDPFFTTRREGGGTGLGLPIVHGIATGLGGAVALQTGARTGTTFRVYLPAADPASLPGSAASREPATPVGGAAGARGGRILVVDDEPAVLQTAALVLERAGYRVATAATGAEARKLFDADPLGYVALVSDQAMPGLDGTGLVEHARALRPDLAVVVTSGDMDAIRRDRLVALGKVVFVPKPYTRAELVAAVEKARAGMDG